MYILHDNEDHNESLSSLVVPTPMFNKRAIALFILKVKQERKISQTALDEILKDFNYLFQTTENLKEMVIQAIQLPPQLPSTLIPQIHDIFSSSCNVFEGLYSQHLQQSYFKSFMG